MAKQKVTKEQLLYLRNEKEMSNQEIAAELHINVNTVMRRIGRQPDHITRRGREKALAAAEEARRKKAALKAAEETAHAAEPEPQEQPEEEPIAPPEPPENPPAKTNGPRRENISSYLYEFGYIGDWVGKLEDLSKMTAPEPWRFRETPEGFKNADTHILSKHIVNVFRERVFEYDNAPDDELDKIIHIRPKFAYFHTGLYTSSHRGIYACFAPNINPSSYHKRFFVGFLNEISGYFKGIHPLAEHRRCLQTTVPPFDPSKHIRLNLNHITDPQETLKRFPESVQTAWNLPLLLETSVELSRRRAIVEPGIVVAVPYLGVHRYLMPLYITNPEKPDVALIIEPKPEGYYFGSTCIDLRMAYTDARLVGRPSVKWLTDLVED